MSQDGPGDLHKPVEDVTSASRFTYRDLRLLGQYSTQSPLRVIALVDFDCFYAQCERVRLGLPEEQPLGVLQFKHVIATNYPARAAGLKKVVTAVEARRLCPNIILQHVPTWREGDSTWAYRDDAEEHMREDKSSLDYYRLQSRRAIEVVKQQLPQEPLQKVEKASIDEIFLDLSAQVHAILLDRYETLLDTDASSASSLDQRLPKPWTELLDWQEDAVFKGSSTDQETDAPDWDDVAMNIGSQIIRDIRREIFEQLQYTCSAGIACNKVVAKLAAGHNKPNKQTVVRNKYIDAFLASYKLTKLRGFGGKLGQEVVKAFAIEQVADLLAVPLARLRAVLGSETGTWVYRVIRGMEYSEVSPRTQLQSMLSAKTFEPGIHSLEQADRWLQIFAADIIGRIAEQEGRRPKTVAIHHHVNGRFGPTRSKQTQIPLGSKLDADSLKKLARGLLVDVTKQEPAWPCWTLSMSVSDFFDVDSTSTSISALLMQQKPAKSEYVTPQSLTIAVEALPHHAVPRKRTILDFQGFASSASSLPDNHAWFQSERRSIKQPRTDPSLAHTAKQAQQNPTDIDTEGSYCCPTCTEIVPAKDVLEHLDWHVASDLQSKQ